MWNSYQIVGAILIIGGAFGGLLFWYGGKIQQDKSDSKQIKEIKESIEKSDSSIKIGQERILTELVSLTRTLQDRKYASNESVIKQAEKTYEITKNYNANFLIKEGYENKGQIGTWFTPMWNGVNTKKFFLSDFVGGLEKNRISIYFDKSELVYRILTADGSEEKISIDTIAWKKGKPYLIFASWDTNKKRAQLYAGERGNAAPQIEEKIINNLYFDKMGPLVFMGIDFEGKFPANIKPGSLKLSESNALKKMGYSQHKD